MVGGLSCQASWHLRILVNMVIPVIPLAPPEGNRRACHNHEVYSGSESFFYYFSISQPRFLVVLSLEVIKRGCFLEFVVIGEAPPALLTRRFDLL